LLEQHDQRRALLVADGDGALGPFSDAIDLRIVFVFAAMESSLFVE
jgi:hypothetical protein